jgi:type I restriction enzyme, S subunit
MTLPQSWAVSSIGALADRGQYGWTTKAAQTGEVKFLRTTDITKGSIDWSSVPFCAEVPGDLEKYLLEPGDIVISRAGSVGFSRLLEKIPSHTVFASYLIRFKPSSAVVPRYLSAYLNSDAYWTGIGAASVGIALANVNAKSLAALPVPLAPLAEQKRIADKLDTVLTRVDAVNTRLARVAPLLKRFRQSVLAAATSGRLTEDWRAVNQINSDWLGKPALALKDYAKLDMGFAFKSADFLNEGLRLLRGDNIEPGGLRWRDAKHIDEDAVRDLGRGCAEFCVNGQSTAGASRLVRKHNDIQEARSTRTTVGQPAGRLQEA